jgi:hypothetical protein
MHPDNADHDASPAAMDATPEVDATLRLLADFEHRVEALRTSATSLSARDRAIAEREARAQSALAEAEARRTEAEARAQELARTTEQLAALRAELDSREAAIRETEARASSLDALARTIADREQSLDQREGAIADRDRAVAERESAIEQRESASATAAAHTAQTDTDLAARLEAAQTRADELETRVSQLREEAETTQREMERAVRMLTDSHRELAEAKASVAPLETEVRALRSAAAAPAGPARSDAFNRTRRTRLVSIRRRLRNDAKKLEQISRVLGERQAKVSASEKMVSMQKSTLLEAESAREEAEKARGEAASMLNAARRVQERYERRGAAATAATFIASSIVALGLVAAGSWVGVNRVVQPECRASSTITMSPGADQLGEEAAAVWEEFVAGLPDDPRFIEYTAGRYKARGVKELASPVALATRLEESLMLEPVGPGRLVASLEGTGAGRTTQTLSTLATSMATYANETRGIRADGATTASDTAPATQAEIVEDPRIQLFGMVAGAASCAVLFALLLVWRSLRGAVIRAVRDTADVLPMGTAEEASLVPAIAGSTGPDAPVQPIRQKQREGIQRRGSFKG